ncbi:hypothetical protein BS78_03G400700 [Paspalum vaginatum]|nr:hypothetical protein BS78_03G400700 [Paspalum vaginatum]
MFLSLSPSLQGNQRTLAFHETWPIYLYGPIVPGRPGSHTCQETQWGLHIQLWIPCLACCMSATLLMSVTTRRTHPSPPLPFRVTIHLFLSLHRQYSLCVCASTYTTVNSKEIFSSIDTVIPSTNVLAVPWSLRPIRSIFSLPPLRPLLSIYVVCAWFSFVKRYLLRSCTSLSLSLCVCVCVFCSEPGKPVACVLDCLLHLPQTNNVLH